MEEVFLYNFVLCNCSEKHTLEVFLKYAILTLIFETVNKVSSSENVTLKVLARPSICNCQIN